MKAPSRALLGAAGGAVLVLLVHPSTRPGLTAAFLPLPPGGLQRLTERPELAPPTDLDSGAAYLHAGAERMQSGRPLAADEVRTLLQIADQGGRREPDNPFWPLAEFVFRNGRGPEARAAFRRASRERRYFDHQRAQIENDLRRVARGASPQAWTYAAVAADRSSAMVWQIRDLALRTLRSIPKGPERTEFTFEAISNGALVRDGSERLGLGLVGIDLIENSTYPTAGKGSFVRRLWIAKTSFTGALRAEGRGADAAFCDAQFRKDDSWEAFRDVEDPDGRLQTLSTVAVVVDAAPGALLVAALAGGLVWLFSKRLTAIADISDRFRGWGLAACCFTLLVIGALLGYPTIALAAGACALVPALGPSRTRPYDRGPLGPLHVLIVGFLALSLILVLGFAALARSLPGQVLHHQGEVGAVLGDWRRWAAGALVVLGASALAPPAWAVVRRFSTPAVAARTYRDLGRSLAASSLVLAILASPASLALDRWVGNSLAEIVLNEQNAYSPSNVEER